MCHYTIYHPITYQPNDLTRSVGGLLLQHSIVTSDLLLALPVSVDIVNYSTLWLTVFAHLISSFPSLLTYLQGCQVVIFKKRTGHREAKCVEGNGDRAYPFPVDEEVWRSVIAPPAVSATEPRPTTKSILVHFVPEKLLLANRIL